MIELILLAERPIATAHQPAADGGESAFPSLIGPVETADAPDAADEGANLAWPPLPFVQPLPLSGVPAAPATAGAAETDRLTLSAPDGHLPATRTRGGVILGIPPGRKDIAPPLPEFLTDGQGMVPPDDEGEAQAGVEPGAKRDDIPPAGAGLGAGAAAPGDARGLSMAAGADPNDAAAALALPGASPSPPSRPEAQRHPPSREAALSLRWAEGTPGPGPAARAPQLQGPQPHADGTDARPSFPRGEGEAPGAPMASPGTSALSPSGQDQPANVQTKVVPLPPEGVEPARADKTMPPQMPVQVWVKGRIQSISPDLALPVQAGIGSDGPSLAPGLTQARAMPVHPAPAAAVQPDPLAGVTQPPPPDEPVGERASRLDAPPLRDDDGQKAVRPQQPMPEAKATPSPAPLPATGRDSAGAARSSSDLPAIGPRDLAGSAPLVEEQFPAPAPAAPGPFLQPAIPAGDISSVSPDPTLALVSGPTAAAAPQAAPVAPPTAPPAPPPVLQLAEALRSNSGEKTEIRLDPAGLGRLRFEITQRGEVPLVVLAAERPETADLMRRHLPELQAEFRAMGFAGAEFSFSGWEGGRDGQAPGQTPPQADAPTPGPHPPTASGPADIPVASRSPRAAPPAGGLDLRL